MGCVSSKIMKRSRSFQEELSLSLQKRTSGLPGLEGIVAGKNGGGEQFLALLTTANTLAAKFRVEKTAREKGTFSTCPSEAEHDEKAMAVATKESDEPTSLEVINAWELMADLEQEGEEDDHNDDDAGEKQEPRQRPLLQNITRTVETNGDAMTVGANVSRSRSFRTVEDFNAMVVEHCSDPGKGKDEEHTIEGDVDKPPQRPDEFTCTDKNVKPGRLAEFCPTMSSRRSSTNDSAGAEGDVTGNRSFVEKKGLRRRAMAKELKSLSVPSFEFDSVGSLREWLGGSGQVSSPGSYVTPKFGSFGVATPGGNLDSGCEQETLFDPQLVADLEEAMEQLTMEEEHILRQIVEGLPWELEEEEDEENT